MTNTFLSGKKSVLELRGFLKLVDFLKEQQEKWWSPYRIIVLQYTRALHWSDWLGLGPGWAKLLVLIVGQGLSLAINGGLGILY